MDKILYVVSGFMRTGTTMMMKALEAGGMNAVYDDELYELSPTRFHSHGFPMQLEGSLIKCMGGATVSFGVMPHGIRVVFMMRNPREIEESYEKMFSKSLCLDNYDRDMKYIIDRLRNRKDVESVTIFDYSSVVNHPEDYLTSLKVAGWDMDVDKAAKIIDPKLYRCRHGDKESTGSV